MRITIAATAALIAATLVSLPATCRGEDRASKGTGLEVAQYRNLSFVSGDDLGPGAQSIGLTEDAIRDRVELRLRGAEINSGRIPGRNDYLYVSVRVYGPAYKIYVSFLRPVMYFVGDREFESIGTTWSTQLFGTHGDSAAFIIDSLDSLLDRFLNEYLGANQR